MTAKAQTANDQQMTAVLSLQFTRGRHRSSQPCDWNRVTSLKHQYAILRSKEDDAHDVPVCHRFIHCHCIVVYHRFIHCHCILVCHWAIHRHSTVLWLLYVNGSSVTVLYSEFHLSCVPVLVHISSKRSSNCGLFVVRLHTVIALTSAIEIFTVTVTTVECCCKDATLRADDDLVYIESAMLASDDHIRISFTSIIEYQHNDSRRSEGAAQLTSEVLQDSYMWLTWLCCQWCEQ